MNVQLQKIFYISLVVSSNLIQAPLVCVSFSGKNLLDGTMQGKKCKTEISKFEDQVIEEIEKERLLVAAQEQTMKKALQEIAKKREQFDAKHKNSPKNGSIFAKEKDELFQQIDNVNNKQQELEKSQQLFLTHFEQAAKLIKNKYDLATKLFYKDIATRYGTMHGWDIVFEENNKDLVFYMSDQIDKTQELIALLNKQVCAQEKIYQTRSDIKKLFDDLGIVYLESIKIDSSVHGDIDATKSTYYRENKELLDQYKIKYAPFIAQHHRAPFCIQWISEKIGFGVFATSDIKAGDFVQEYIGVLRVPSKHKGLFADDTAYAWNYPPVGNYTEPLHVDAKFEGNEMRFVNHSSHPNTVRVTTLSADNLFHICYIAQQDIKSGEQILVNYGDAYWASRNYYEELS